MELPHLGRKCANADCKQLDFLPLHCQCGRVFCSDHLNSHVQTCIKSKFLTEAELRNIENVFVCSEEGCGERSVVPLICQRCDKHFCVRHRHLTECSQKSLTMLEKEKEKYREPVRQFDKAKAVVDKQVENHIAEAKKRTKNKDMAVKLQLMKIKNKATGLRTIPTSDRVYFNIHVLPQSQGSGKTVPMFVSKTWSLGRTIDAVADECKLQNYNNRSAEKKLRLFKEDNDSELSPDLSVGLDSLLQGGVIVDGESLVIEYVEV